MKASTLLISVAIVVSANSEVVCLKGTFIGDEGSPHCTQCHAGRFSWRTNSKACDDCPSGSTSNDARTSCQPCPAGTFSPSDGSICEPCPEGEFTARPRAVKCFSCPSGQTSEPLRSGTQCADCPAGRFSEPNNEGCFDCPDGQFNKSPGSSKCEKCPRGAAECHRETGIIEVEISE
jgi:deleted in malignant brain tumors 1 protein